MKITYENKWEKAVLHVDVEKEYRQDYQIRMLDCNKIGNLLKVTAGGRDGQSRYSFQTNDFVSMEKEYSRKEMKKEDVELFINQLTETVKEVREHLLNPDHILLLPELIFVKDGIYHFCYLPQREPEDKRSLCASFHELTEYFVRKLDHSDTEGVFLVYKLHRETFRDSYDLGKILEGYRKEESARREKESKKGIEEKSIISESAVFYAAEEDEAEKDLKKGGRLKRAARKIKTGRWGQWEDLITEMDGQEQKRPL